MPVMAPATAAASLPILYDASIPTLSSGRGGRDFDFSKQGVGDSRIAFFAVDKQIGTPELSPLSDFLIKNKT